MEVTDEDKKVIGQFIDTQIQSIPQIAQFSKNENVKENLAITNPQDFAMGMIYDSILGSITNYFIQKMQLTQAPTPEQFMEIMQVATSETMDRLTDIKKAIHDSELF